VERAIFLGGRRAGQRREFRSRGRSPLGGWRLENLRGAVCPPRNLGRLDAERNVVNPTPMGQLHSPLRLHTSPATAPRQKGRGRAWCSDLVNDDFHFPDAALPAPRPTHTGKPHEPPVWASTRPRKPPAAKGRAKAATFSAAVRVLKRIEGERRGRPPRRSGQ